MPIGFASNGGSTQGMQCSRCTIFGSFGTATTSASYMQTDAVTSSDMVLHSYPGMSFYTVITGNVGGRATDGVFFFVFGLWGYHGRGDGRYTG